MELVRNNETHSQYIHIHVYTLHMALMIVVRAQVHEAAQRGDLVCLRSLVEDQGMHVNQPTEAVRI